MIGYINSKVLSGRRSQRGFTLIELGIVVAVIAVLATVVIFGRGFILSTRVTKAVDAAGTVRRAASTMAGTLGGQLNKSSVSEMPRLAARQFLPDAAGTGPWVVSGSGSDVIQVIDIRFDQITVPSGNDVSNAVLIRFSGPTNAVAQDIARAFRQDPNVVSATGVTLGELPCEPVPADGNVTFSGNEVNMCFYL